jgi:hypothetical protein
VSRWPHGVHADGRVRCLFNDGISVRVANPFRTRACASPSADSTPENTTQRMTGSEHEINQVPRPPWADPDYTVAPPDVAMPSQVPVADAMEFFKAREGTWSSWRVTHHLAFRRAESGASEIIMKCLDKDDERIVKLLKENDLSKDAAQGGCYVTWKAVMAWDQEGENHEGSTVFALVADKDDVRRGRIIRDRGYAEIVPIAGTYFLDKENALCLETPYDGGAVDERFVFETIDLLHRVSTVRRFGGLSNATFTTERRISPRTPDSIPYPSAAEITEEDVQRSQNEPNESFTNLGSMEDEDEDDESCELTQEELDLILSGDVFLFGGGGGRATESGAGASTTAQSTPLSSNAARIAAARRGAEQRQSPPVGSAFSQGFSGGNASTSAERAPSSAASRAGIDLSKVPPSMRADFEKSLRADEKLSSSNPLSAEGLTHEDK